MAGRLRSRSPVDSRRCRHWRGALHRRARAATRARDPVAAATRRLVTAARCPSPRARQHRDCLRRQTHADRAPQAGRKPSTAALLVSAAPTSASIWLQSRAARAKAASRWANTRNAPPSSEVTHVIDTPIRRTRSLHRRRKHRAYGETSAQEAQLAEPEGRRRGTRRPAASVGEPSGRTRRRQRPLPHRCHATSSMASR